MSTKPVLVPRFGVTAADALAANVTAPSSGQQDTGWTPSQLADSSFDNWYKAWTTRWLKYLSDGAMSGAFTFDNAVTIAGLVTASGNAHIVGDLTLDGYLKRAGLSRSYAPRGEFQNPGTGSPGISGDIDDYTLSTLGGSLRIPLHGLEPGDRITDFVVAWEGPAGYPDPVVQYESHGTAPEVLATTDGSGGTINGRKIRRYTVNTPVALGYYLANSPDVFTQRAAIKLIAASNATILYGLTVNYDKVAPRFITTAP